MSTRTPLPTVNERDTENVSTAAAGTRPAPPGASPLGALSAAAPTLPRLPIYSELIIFLTPSTARFAGSVVSADIPPPPKPGVPSLIPPLLSQGGGDGAGCVPNGDRAGEGSSGGLLPSPEMQTCC